MPDIWASKSRVPSLQQYIGRTIVYFLNRQGGSNLQDKYLFADFGGRGARTAGQHPVFEPKKTGEQSAQSHSAVETY